MDMEAMYLCVFHFTACLFIMRIAKNETVDAIRYVCRQPACSGASSLWLTRTNMAVKSESAIRFP